MKIYLDNCCYNRPYDDHSQTKIQKEADSVISIQQQILENKYDLVWSYIIEYENFYNPFPEKRNSIVIWKKYAQINVEESGELLAIAELIKKFGISSKDCLHIASAVIAGCSYFITTDLHLISRLKNYENIKVINPVEFLLIAKN